MIFVILNDRFKLQNWSNYCFFFNFYIYLNLLNRIQDFNHVMLINYKYKYEWKKKKLLLKNVI